LGFGVIDSFMYKIATDFQRVPLFLQYKVTRYEKTLRKNNLPKNPEIPQRRKFLRSIQLSKTIGNKALSPKPRGTIRMYENDPEVPCWA